jgi:uncharacterized protein with HEPN domain
MRTEKLYLVDIVEAAEAIDEFMRDLNEAEFYSDRKTQSAVVPKLAVIGEAAAQLSSELKARYPGIEWRQIVSLRNVLAHAYFSVKLPRIWVMVKQDVPQLRDQVSQILVQEFK